MSRRHARPEKRGTRASLALRLALIALLAVNAGCIGSGGVGPNADVPLRTVEAVDLDRFAGRWYVIESMPTSQEEGAHDAVEIYTMEGEGRIDIQFTFREGSFDGPLRSIPQRGRVHDETTNAEWRVSPLWPIWLDYLILDLGPDYEYTVVGHPSKKYVWIMSREPALEAETLAEIRQRLADAGYDVSRIQPVPQRPLAERED